MEQEPYPDPACLSPTSAGCLRMENRTGSRPGYPLLGRVGFEPLPWRPAPEVIGAGRAASIREVLVYANDIRLANEQQQALVTRLKVRHIGCAGAWLMRKMQLRRDNLIRAVIGAWEYVGLHGGCRKAIRAVAEAKSKQAEDARGSTSSAVTLLMRSSMKGPIDLLADYVRRWRSYSRNAHCVRRRANDVVYFLAGTSSWLEVMLSHVIRSWQAITDDGREFRRIDATRLDRRKLLIEYTEVLNELADLRVRIESAEDVKHVLQGSASNALGSLELAIGGGRARSGCVGGRQSGGKAILEPQDVKGAEAASLAELHELRQKLRVDAAKFRSSLSDAAPRSMFMPPQRPVCVEEAAGLAAEETASNIVVMREKRDRLQSTIQALRGRAHAAMVDFQTRADQELAGQRVVTEDLTHRVSKAKEWVAGLKRRHSLLLAAEADRDRIMVSAPHPGQKAPEGLMSVQEALCNLAKVSEELMDPPFYSPEVPS